MRNAPDPVTTLDLPAPYSGHARHTAAMLDALRIALDDLSGRLSVLAQSHAWLAPSTLHQAVVTILTDHAAQCLAMVRQAEEQEENA